MKKRQTQKVGQGEEKAPAGGAGGEWVIIGEDRNQQLLCEGMQGGCQSFPVLIWIFQTIGGTVISPGCACVNSYCHPMSTSGGM